MTSTSVLQYSHTSAVGVPLHDQSEDYVYPVHLLDGTTIQHVVFTGFLRFNDVLDAQKIHDALLTLLQIGDWKKLGGRLRHSNDGKLEIHVPRQYTAERPAFRYAHESFDCRISDHPSAGEFPEPADGLSVKSPPADIRQLALGPGFASTIEELIDHDAPQLSLKIMTFTDATLMATTYPHITWDASGYLAFTKMIQFVLDGREDEVMPMLGAQHDILAEIASRHQDGRKEDPFLKRMGQETTQKVVPRIPSVEERIICIPTDVLNQLQNRLQEECSEDDVDCQSLRGDELLSAWAIQQLARAEPTPRPVAVMNILNARFFIPSLAKIKGLYTQNMLLAATNTLPAETATGPIGQIALSQRECIAALASPQQAAGFIASFLGAIEANVDTSSLSNNSDATPLFLNNLDKLTNRLDIDFSSAVVRQGEETTSRMNPLGTVTFGFIKNLSNPYPMPKLNIFGKLTGDTCWLSGELPKRAWELMEEDLESLYF